jgi:hypothetical protein
MTVFAEVLVLPNNKNNAAVKSFSAIPRINPPYARNPFRPLIYLLSFLKKCKKYNGTYGTPFLDSTSFSIFK